MGLLKLLDYHIFLRRKKKCIYKQIGDGCNHHEIYPEAYSAPFLRFLILKKGGKDCFSMLSPMDVFSSLAMP
jgi:hypothetical protein